MTVNFFRTLEAYKSLQQLRIFFQGKKQLDFCKTRKLYDILTCPIPQLSSSFGKQQQQQQQPIFLAHIGRCQKK